MYANKSIWTGLFEDTQGRRGCNEYWVSGDRSAWLQISRLIPQGTTLVVVFPGRKPEGMLWAPVGDGPRSDQQRVDVWETPED